jgi:hypothetical protein
VLELLMVCLRWKMMCGGLPRGGVTVLMCAL